MGTGSLYDAAPAADDNSGEPIEAGAEEVAEVRGDTNGEGLNRWGLILEGEG